MMIKYLGLFAIICTISIGTPGIMNAQAYDPAQEACEALAIILILSGYNPCNGEEPPQCETWAPDLAGQAKCIKYKP